MKTRKVLYKTKPAENYVIGGFTLECVTECNVNGVAGNVGSLACHECGYFVSDTYIDADQCGVVECKAVENRRDSSPAVGFPK